MDLYVQALVMGVVQGLTEFLPISSSGHLIVLPSLLGWDDPLIESLLFSVVLHLGTLLALVLYFARDWALLIRAAVGLLRERRIGDDLARRLVVNIALATVPAALLGVLFDDAIASTVREPLLVAVLLVVGGGLLLVADRIGTKSRDVGHLGPRGALAVGFGQALALLPGMSRSGTSIAVGLLAGLDRAAAARFSFLMATPIIAGAGLFEARKLFGPEGVGDEGLGLVVVGFAAAFLSGLLAIRFMLRYLRTNSLAIFVVYRVALAAVVVAVVGTR